MNKNRYRISEIISDLLFFTAGGAVYAAAVLVFLSSNKISPGGVTGIASVLNYLSGFPIGTAVFLLNLPLLLLGFFKLGGIFIVKTTVGTFIMSVALDIGEAVFPYFKLDIMLSAIFGGLLMGLGQSLFMLRGATTGGSDIVAVLINRKIPHMTVGRLILLTDAAVVALAAVVYKNLESALYSVVALYAATKVIDIVIYGADRGKIVYAITGKPDKMSGEIMSLVGRGITAIDATGAYTGAKKKMLMCTVRPNEVSAVCKIIRENDGEAFTVIADAGEILGEGFKRRG